MSEPQAEARIDLEAYRRNIQILAGVASTAQFLAVVKANAYGHGAIPMARAAREAGADWLGVVTLDEALALRRAGDTGPLLCWLTTPGADFGAAARHDIEVTASSVEQLREILSHAEVPRIQLKVDTGLGRNGAYGEQWSELVAEVAQVSARGGARLTGVWSHFACSDEPDHPANDAQETRFREAIEELESAGLEPGLRHIANSAAIMTRPSAHFDLVRAGIAAYGLPPDPAMPHQVAGLTPVLTLRARLAAVKRVPAGLGVSYGYRHVTDRETTLGLVPIGYGEGIHRRSTGHAQAWFAGQRVPVVGTICMDQMVVDLGDLPARRGDVITLFGAGAQGEPTAVDWAEAAGTIAYEVVTGLGGRIQHTYHEGAL